MIDFFNFFKLLVFKQLRGGLNCFINSRSPFVIFVQKNSTHVLASSLNGKCCLKAPFIENYGL